MRRLTQTISFRVTGEAGRSDASISGRSRSAISRRALCRSCRAPGCLVAFAARPSNAVLHAAFAPLRHVEEQIIERKLPPRQSLLMGVCAQRLEGTPVSVGEPVFPGVGAHELFLLLPGLPVKRERDDPWIRQPLHREALRFVE